MGFECGFFKVKRVDKSISPLEYLYIDSIKRYNENSFIKEHYATFKDYFESNFSYVSPIKCVYPDLDTSDWVDVEEEHIAHWCSIGNYLDKEFIIKYIEEFKPFETYLVTKSFIENAIEEIDNTLERYEFIPVRVVGATSIKGDDKIIFDVEDLIVEDEDGDKQILIDADNTIYVSNDYIDIDRLNATKDLKKTLIELSEIDFDEYFVFYYRSY